MQIAGKVAVITGGARGTAKRIADVLVERDAKVVLGDILKQGSQVAAALNKNKSDQVAIFQHCDVCNFHDIQNLVDSAIREFGCLDIMTENAGVNSLYLWASTKSEPHSRAVGVNFKVPMEGTHLVVRAFYAAKRPGCVINMASVMDSRPFEYASVYCATKATLVLFAAASASLAESIPPIRVNAIAPIYVDTTIVRDNAPEQINKIIQVAGTQSLDDVANEAIRCIEDESLAGDTIIMEANFPGNVHDGPKARSVGLVKSIK
ncbi:hypothetical protein IW140_005061 [Coemansia sp. RSA 1813]|nr:hypothetical protein EV178_002206 [Coemansia sp. RSA 1646]KAJ1769254.1 hypothetical protein LPJ74_004190 [Coemansia sp. RSA 1843]KAJ2090294.1 hypothetical protein IW138_002719 [Coemansia sp. RSA 986]KAJ2215484.1 hypothetical protein EV179_002076 [Coemansia sp. RSA 487]KAJ2566079.1 hypothetical protein IW140_005061 [Coemansia sp. RSA 1813]